MINANPIYKIKINKTDKVKVTPVQGAVYTIINPEGVVVEDVTNRMKTEWQFSKELSKRLFRKSVHNNGKISTKRL